MAIFDLDVRAISRAAGRSATAAAAYRAGCAIVDARTGERHDYTRRSGVAHAAIVTPAGCPTPDRAALWNAAETAERRCDAKVAREVRVALPHELTHAAQVALAERLAGALAERFGVAVDVAVHTPDQRHQVAVALGVTIGGDERNVHAHLLMTTRRMTPDGQLGAKTRELDVKETSHEHVRWIRQHWGQLANEALAVAAEPARVDHRSLRARGIDRAPQIHLGPAALMVARDRPAEARAAAGWRERREWAAEADQRLAAAAQARHEAREARSAVEAATDHLADLVSQLRAEEDDTWRRAQEAAEAHRRAQEARGQIYVASQQPAPEPEPPRPAPPARRYGR